MLIAGVFALGCAALVAAQARACDPKAQGGAPDLTGPIGPLEPILSRLDSLVSAPIELRDAQFNDLLAVVRNGLLDPRARPKTSADSCRRCRRASARL